MKRILTTLAQKWPEYLLEILVITIGIFGAFMLNNWNQDRKDRIAKQLMVENIEREFSKNQIQLEKILREDRKAISACDTLFRLINTDKIPNEEAIDTILNELNSLWSFNPSAGALRSAISSGQIHLLDQEMLKEFLFSWEDMVEDSREEEFRFINDQLTVYPKFYDRIRAANNVSIYDDRVPKSRYSSDYLALFNDPAFENYLADHLIFLLDAERELVALKIRINEILEMLKQES